MSQKTEKEILELMVANPRLRRTITRRSFYWFFVFYFARYMDYPVALFQREMMALAEDRSIQNVVIAGFRGSAKSTILSLAFVVWSVLGEHRIRHVLIGSKTEQKAQQLLQHIKDELDPDSLLKKDLGPFKEFKTPWNMSGIVLKKYDARISVVSMEQHIRGVRYKQFRPQLIVLDDIEDIDSVKTQESRDKLFEKLTREIIPAGTLDTRMIFIGNKLHADSAMERLQRAIASGEMAGEFRNYPALANGAPLWAGKHKDKAGVESEKLRGMTELSYRREMLLEIIPDGYQILSRRDFRLFRFGETYPDYRFTLIGIDPAARTKPENDCTAIVTADIYGYGPGLKIRIRPHPINARLRYEGTVEKTLHIVQSIGSHARVCIEGVGFQDMFLVLLKNRGVNAEAVPVRGKSKEDRLLSAAVHIQTGTVEFADSGNEELIAQALHFGSGDHDDLVDALSLVVLQSIEMAAKESGFFEYMRAQAALDPRVFARPRGMSDWIAMARQQGGLLR